MKNKNSNKGIIKKTKEFEKQESTIKFNYNKFINKRNIIILLIVIIFIIFSFLFLNKDSSVADIKLDSYADSLYAWKYEIKDESIVKLVEKTRQDNSNSENVPEAYTFKALKEGKTTITFNYVNKNNGSFMNIYRYSVTVDKDLKLTIKKVEYNNN